MNFPTLIVQIVCFFFGRYSGCNVCTGSRASLMTGRQFARTGLPGVIGPSCSYGLNLNEITIAEQLKKANYSTAIVGKWHLGYVNNTYAFDYCCCYIYLS